MELRSRYMSMLEDQIKEENEKAQIDANNFALVTGIMPTDYYLVLTFIINTVYV